MTFSIILFAVLLRLIPHPPNFAPIAAMALFGGTYLDRRYALIAPLIALFISDLFLGLHTTMPFVYGSFFLTGLIGFWLKRHRSVQTIALGAFASSLLFFLITNFGVWLVGGLYPKTLSGLIQSYVMALPFFRNTIIGDLFYSGLFFGGYEVVKNVILNSFQDLRPNEIPKPIRQVFDSEVAQTRGAQGGQVRNDKKK